MYEAADRSPVEIARTAAAGFTDYSGVGATWRIAPNPATTASPMRLLPGSSERVLEVWVFDPTGRMLFPVRPEDALSGFTLDGLPAGVYTFKVRTSGGWRAVKGVWGG